MLVYAVDLGTTNIKVVLFDELVRPLAVAREPVSYHRDGQRVEFDPDAVFDAVLRLIHTCAAEAERHPRNVPQIVVTGQAESFVLCDSGGLPLAPGISWMDERAVAEVDEIAEQFHPADAFAVTGQPKPAPIWPATKLRWLAKNRPDLAQTTRRVLMLKDYVLLRLTGLAVGEETTRGFTYMYDVPRRRYWTEMADFCGFAVDTFPDTVPAGATVGPVLAEVAESLPPATGYTVNAGALDHFCTMVGTSAYRPGALSASAGTVLALSMLASAWSFDPSSSVSFHPGLRAGETVLFNCADSGGIALDWFLSRVVGDLGYEELESELNRRNSWDAPIFLPYLTGLNPPELNATARGAFLDLQLRHDRIDMAAAVMEGVAHLLRRNMDELDAHGQRTQAIVTAGGGTASSYWNQRKADACGVDVHVPDEQEATCRGAAVLAHVASGELGALDDASSLPSPPERVYLPRFDDRQTDRYSRFDSALRRLYGP